VSGLLDDVKISTAGATAAGTTTITGSSIDMAGFAGALVIIRLGTPASNNNIRLQQCDTASGTYADLLGTLVGNSTDTPLVVDVMKPTKQFLKYQITRGTSTTIDGVTVIQYGARTRPTTQPGTTLSESHKWPSEGTA
jgi:hypothetical protein